MLRPVAVTAEVRTAEAAVRVRAAEVIPEEAVLAEVVAAEEATEVVTAEVVVAEVEAAPPADKNVDNIIRSTRTHARVLYFTRVNRLLFPNIANNVLFSCIYAKFFVPLHPQLILYHEKYCSSILWGLR